MKFLLFQFFIFSLLISKSNGQIVIEGGFIIIDGGAVIVIDNPSSNAITRSGSGYISSEDMANKIIWYIGAGDGNSYQVPFGKKGNFMPLNFTVSSGSTDGHFVFSSYATPTWKNSDYLPPGVTNVNSGANDNSEKVMDRFWQINPKGYTTSPELSNVVFTYAEDEINPPNSINENSLIAQRWNNILQKWDDYLPNSKPDISNNTITIATVPGSQLFDWWTMVDGSAPLPVSLIRFKAVVADKTVVVTWQTSSEINTHHFEIWRTKNLSQFDSLESLPAAGNSITILNYQFTDSAPYSGTSFYRLKSVDRDGKYSWSQTVSVAIKNKNPVALFPNPADNTITIISNHDIAEKKPLVSVHDSKGSQVRSFVLTAPVQQVNIATLPSGAFYIRFKVNGAIFILKFIKK